MRKRISIVLAQLPLQEPDVFSSPRNVPLAGGYLAAYARKHLGTEVDISLLPRDLADQAGDAALLRWVETKRPDVLGLTLYLWNRERSLFLARGAKRLLPGLVTVAGGPETAGAPEPPSPGPSPGGGGRTQGFPASTF